MDESVERRVGRLEDKVTLYEPILQDIRKISSVPDDVGKLQSELQALREFRVEIKEKLAVLLKSQDKVYTDVIAMLKERSKTIEREVRECPIKEVQKEVEIFRVIAKEVETLKMSMAAVISAIESFKVKGWDFLLRLVPWLLTGAATIYALIKS